QFGGANGELKAAMQYFVQSFSARQAFPKHYDLLMDIATEEFSHLEIVGATITMLLDGINADLKRAAEQSPLMKLTQGKAAKEEVIHEALMNPHFLALSGGGPTLTDSRGVPWTGAYVTANGDLTVDLRSNMAAESRAKIVYEYLLQYTDDPHVQDSLRFLMTREIAHYQMFGTALETIQPNFPPGILQGDPRYTHLYFNMSNGMEVRGPWNEGRGPWRQDEQWVYIDDPIAYVDQTAGLTEGRETRGSRMSAEQAEKLGRELGRNRADAIRSMIPQGENQWSAYGPDNPSNRRP
ncbi:MAG TPA: manganese catalase family protein, partial [Gemmatimonadales bacterium]|nr:manganese catalase family protein [Gemmatimonadales bacterium]